MKATEKHPAIEAFISTFTNASRKGAVAEGSCTWCHEMVGKFRNPKSRKEYTISGMCQPCQDDFFGKD
tara:strand:+ start:2700 stop:2903 length:204 start_codon:yes stop_codon:yes gene_type:complete